MGIKIKEGHWDIYSIILLSTIFTLIVLLLPGLELLRIFFGILFLFFFPGYVTTSAIWPMKYDISEDKSEEEKFYLSDIDNKEKLEEIQQNSKLLLKTINNVTRISISLAISVIIIPIIAFIYNELYPLNNEIFGLRLIPLLLTIYVYIISGSGLAVWRREMTSKNERYMISFEIKAPFDNSISDKIITISLIVLILISLGAGVYLYKFYHENEKFTEFYILGPQKKISNYPKNFFINEEKNIFIGINNKEFERIEYEVQIFLRNNSNLEERDTLHNIHLSPDVGYSYKVSVGHNKGFQSPLYFKVNETGRYDLNFHLIKNNQKYRELTLKINVFDKNDMYVNMEENFKFFILSSSGEPGNFPSTMDSGYSLTIQLGIENLGNDPLSLRISISTDNPDRWFFDADGKFSILNQTGYFFYSTIMNKATMIYKLDITIPEGTWSLNFSADDENDLSINKNIIVH